MRTEVLLLPESVLLPSDTVLPPAEHPDTALEHNLHSPAAATASSGTLEARSSLGASGLRCWAREPVPPLAAGAGDLLWQLFATAAA